MHLSLKSSFGFLLSERTSGVPPVIFVNVEAANLDYHLFVADRGTILLSSLLHTTFTITDTPGVMRTNFYYIVSGPIIL